eukprot:UN10933
MTIILLSFFSRSLLFLFTLLLPTYQYDIIYKFLYMLLLFLKKAKVFRNFFSFPFFYKKHLLI